MKISERLREKMLQMNLSESELSRRSGVPQPTIHRIVSGESQSPRRENLQRLARALKVSATWLTFGSGDDASIDANVELALQPSRSFSYPEISWVQAGNASEAVEMSNIAAAPRHTSDVWAGESGFWLKVVGSSMTSPLGDTFPEGFLILVAPDIEPRPGQYVVARMEATNEATFKQLVYDAGDLYLKPLNPAFSMRLIDDTWVIVGTVVDGKMPKSVFF
jgi:SOS-response transcriptional repressor LexA